MTYELKENPEPSVEDLIKVFWKAYEDYPKRDIQGRKKVSQSDLYKAGFQAVKDCLIQWSDQEWAKRYLAMEQAKAVLEEQPRVWKL